MFDIVRFFRRLGKALADVSGRELAKQVRFGEIIYDIAAKVIHDYRADANDQELRADIQVVAQANASEVKRAVDEIVAEAAPESRDTLADYLAQVQPSIRRSLRRPADPDGKTVPAGVRLRRAADLMNFLPTRLPRFRAGDRPAGVGDWRLVELLGVGGFGEVWKAEHTTMRQRKPAALKFCLDDVAADALRHEADVLGRVMDQGGHPVVVTLTNTFLAADPPCLEYEYIAGGDLGGLIQDHASPDGVPPRLACEIVLELARIVGHLHRLSPALVHRDLKPANVLVERVGPGEVALRVADFGIGGAAASQLARDHATRSSQHARTMPTAVRGAHTPLYASKQQKEGGPSDPRDDVHALGVIWYQALSGDVGVERPSGRSWRKKFEQRGVSAALLDLLERCIDDDAAERPASASELAEELAAHISGVPGAMPVRLREGIVAAAETIIPPSRPEPMWPAPVPVAGVLPPVPEAIRTLEAKISALSLAIASFDDGTHPDLAAAKQLHRRIPGRNDAGFIALLGRLRAALEKNPDGGFAELSASEKGLPDEVLFPVIAALRKRIDQVRERQGAIAESEALQAEDFWEIMQKFLLGDEVGEFPLRVWLAIQPEMRARYYRLGADDKKLLTRAEAAYRDHWQERADWQAALSAYSTEGFSAYLEKHTLTKLTWEKGLLETFFREAVRNSPDDYNTRRHYLAMRGAVKRILDVWEPLWDTRWIVFAVLIGASSLAGSLTAEFIGGTWGGISGGAICALLASVITASFATLARTKQKQGFTSNDFMIILGYIIFSMISGGGLSLPISALIHQTLGGTFGFLGVSVVFIIITHYRLESDSFGSSFSDPFELWFSLVGCAVLIGTVSLMAWGHYFLDPRDMAVTLALRAPFVIALFVWLGCVIAQLWNWRERRDNGPIPWWYTQS